jgi:hypothetical protein
MFGKGIATLLLLLAISFIQAEAQSWRIKQIYRSRPPKAILVQLFTYPRRVAYYQKNKNFDKLHQFNKEAAKTAEQIVRDFNENFNFCPVYYYHDTNAALIREKKFRNVLLDQNLKPAADIIINPKDTNYFIVVNALLISEDFLPGNAPPPKDAYFSASDNVMSNKQRLVVLDYKFKQLPSSTVRTTKGSVGDRKSRKAYSYSSNIFSLEYAGKAAVLNQNFKEFFNPDF